MNYSTNVNSFFILYLINILFIMNDNDFDKYIKYLFLSLSQVDSNTKIFNSTHTIANQSEIREPVDNFRLPKFRNFTHLAGEEFTLEQTNTINLIRLICSSISILGCFFIMLAHFLLWIKSKIIRVRRNTNYSSSSKTSCQSSSVKRNSYNSYNEQYDSGESCHNQIIESGKENLLPNKIITDKFLSNSDNLHENKILIQNQEDKIDKIKFKPSRRDTKTSEKERINKMGLGNELIFFLIISNIGWCIGSFLGIKEFTIFDKDNSLCQAQAFVQNYFDMSSICWNTIISNITLLGTKLTFSEISKKREKMYLFFIYSNVLPILFSLGPVFTDSYGPAGIWCWIDLSHLDIYSYIWIIIFYLFNWGNIFYSIYALISTSMYFSKRQSEIENDQDKIREAKYLKKYIFILRIFPLMLIITRLSGTINRMYSMIKNEDSYFLFAFHSTVFSLVGFFNSLIYSYFYRNVFKECCKKKQTD